MRLLIFLLAILIPACDTSSPAFRMMYSAYELNKQGDDIKPCCSPLQILRQSVIPCHFNCCYMTCIQVSQETGKVVWYFLLFKNRSQFVVNHTKGLE